MATRRDTPVRDGAGRKPRLRTPSMADVAQVAGVSPQTVSRVLRGHPHVTEITRLQVQAAVEQTGYRRTGLARALVTGRSMTLGVITFENAHYAGSALMLGIQRTARDRGYFVSASGTTSLAPAAVAESIDRLRDQGVDGLVIAVPILDEASVQRATAGVPIAIIDGESSSAGDIVRVDHESAGRLATEHLLGLGHQTVWHVAGPATWRDASGRTTGWSKTLRDAGRDVPPVLYGDWSPESGYRSGLVLGRMPDVTAVFVASDEMAFGVVRALTELGRRVPQDVSVVGMDDIALSQYASPALTTIRQPFERMGQIAVDRLVDLVEEVTDEPLIEVITPELMVRGSSAAPAVG